MAAISRRKISEHVAQQLLAGNAGVVRELAAYLVEHHQVKMVELYIRDIETALARHGVIVADVTAARKLGVEMQEAIASMVKSSTGAADVTLRETTDPDVLGGFRLDIPGATLDRTVKHSLDTLRTSKV